MVKISRRPFPPSPADVVAASVALPLLHIADPTGEAVRAAGHRRIGLLGTAFTMEQAFYRDRLTERFGLEVIVPNASQPASFLGRCGSTVAVESALTR